MRVFITTSLALTAVGLGSTQAVFPAEMTALMDTSVNPCEDFYQYSCGNWIKTHDLKPSEVSIDSSFTVISDRNEVLIQEILKEDWPLVGELWESCMNLDKITALGNEPLQKDLNRLVKASNRAQVFQLAGEFSRVGNNAIIAFDVGADPKDATTNTVYAFAADLTLPSKDYYSDDAFPSVETEYRAYINDLMALSGYPLGGQGPGQGQQRPSRPAADIVIEIEKAIAKIQSQMEEPEDNPRLSITAATFKWPIAFGAYSKGLGLLEKTTLTKDYKVLFGPLEYFDLVEEFLNSISTADLKVYTAFVLVNSRVRWLGEEFLQVWFKFYGQKMNGQQQRAPRETTCVYRQLQYFPDLIGKYYYMKAFDKGREENTVAMIKLIEEAMGQHIARLNWLDTKTRIEAKNKLDKVANLIGQSTVPKVYNFQLSRDLYAENVYTILTDSFNAKMRNAGKPVNRMEWSISPAEVNAYYSPAENKIVFPAAILQPPFFNGPTSHPARNFGAIGAVIGHELTHGFDDSGRLYDGDGNQRQWWTNSTAKEFNTRASCMKTQYSTFKVAGEQGNVLGNVNGNLTIGENIADNGGVSLSWDAYRKYMETVKPKTDGVTPEEGDKMFFIAFSQNWCEKARDGALSQQLATDVHSPNKWRANGVAMNNDDFTKVFKCKANAPMNPTKKCQLW